MAKRKTKAEICAALGSRIRELRLKRGLSQKGLAESVGIHVSFLSDIERGKKGCGIEIAVWLAHELDVRLGELFPDDESYPEEVVDFLIWLRENPDVSMRDVMRKLAGSD